MSSIYPYNLEYTILPFGLPRWLSGKESTYHVGNAGSTPGLERSPGDGNGNPLQFSCLENPRDGGAWWAAVCGVSQSQTVAEAELLLIHSTSCYCCLVAKLCPTLRPHGLLLTRLLCLWGFSRQEYWSGFPCPSPGDLPNPGIKPRSPALQVDSLPSEPLGKPIVKRLLVYAYSLEGKL